jgi:lysophospholipase L1-like esterase
MRRALFWMLFPMVLPQAIRVRRTAPRFAAAQGPNLGTVGDGPGLRILAIGDSIVAGVGAGTTERALAGATASALSAQLGRRVVWRAHGKIGAGVTKVGLELLPQVPDDGYDAVVVSVGVNDITGLARSGPWASRLGHVLDALRARFPNATIALAGMPPLEGFPLLPDPLKRVFGMRAKTFDALARVEVERRQNMIFVPIAFDPLPDKFSADGFHPSADSYAEFGRAISDAIAPRLSLNRQPIRD